MKSNPVQFIERAKLILALALAPLRKTSMNWYWVFFVQTLERTSSEHTRKTSRTWRGYMKNNQLPTKRERMLIELLEKCCTVPHHIVAADTCFLVLHSRAPLTLSTTSNASAYLCANWGDPCISNEKYKKITNLRHGCNAQIESSQISKAKEDEIVVATSDKLYRNGESLGRDDEMAATWHIGSLLPAMWHRSHRGELGFGLQISIHHQFIGSALDHPHQIGYTPKIKYIIFYIFGSPPSWAEQPTLSQSPPKPRRTPGIIRKQSIRQRHLFSDMG